MECIDVSGMAGCQQLMTPRLMFVVNVDWFFISHRLEIALEAQRQGYQVHVVTTLTDKLDELKSHGLVVHPMILDRSSSSFRDALLTMVQLWKIFRAVNPVLVHLVTIKPVLLGGVVARLAGVRAVVAAISGLGFVFLAKGLRATVRRLIVCFLYRLALGHRNLKVIFQNPDDRASLTRLVQLTSDKVEVIRGSGVELTKFVYTPPPHGIPIVMLAARLLADKGVREFVQAAGLLKRRGINARFCLVGNVDPANPSSLTYADLAQWASEGVVELWGHRSDMPQVLSAAQIVVLPSYREGLPKVLIEAAACGRAVITSDCPGCCDAVDPEVTGLLVPVRDTEALANTLEVLINDPERCLSMGIAGRSWAERTFDVRMVVAAHMRIYQELIGKP
jgi:glycosyltransferase involved in cell wall biosynthesis